MPRGGLSNAGKRHLEVSEEQGPRPDATPQPPSLSPEGPEAASTLCPYCPLFPSH